MSSGDFTEYAKVKNNGTFGRDKNQTEEDDEINENNEINEKN
jgi:hypothetical protein